jgi:uncharacterized membrane protein YgdD (TMEM256/DUF423 family)
MGLISVAMGAFGAHALKNKLTPDMLSVFEVGARYQMYHALTIFAAVWISTLTSGLFAPLSGWLFITGSLIFSGSLYLLALTGIRLFGAITPIGGILLLLGWLSLAIAGWKSL